MIVKNKASDFIPSALDFRVQGLFFGNGIPFPDIPEVIAADRKALTDPGHRTIRRVQA